MAKQTYTDTEGAAWEVQQYLGFDTALDYEGARIYLAQGDFVCRNVETGKVTAYTPEDWAQKLVFGEFTPI